MRATQSRGAPQAGLTAAGACASPWRSRNTGARRGCRRPCARAAPAAHSRGPTRCCPTSGSARGTGHVAGWPAGAQLPTGQSHIPSPEPGSGADWAPILPNMRTHAGEAAGANPRVGRAGAHADGARAAREGCSPGPGPGSTPTAGWARTSSPRGPTRMPSSSPKGAGVRPPAKCHPLRAASLGWPASAAPPPTLPPASSGWDK